ncbi:HlyD family efflux transporter periplasmic adaptor subunit [Pseudoduganella sp. FT25W]|uniref:HlyD family efflux transporter periplasmic adaptor subunit n=2 Tax=Duganella alba TaxID=2666081 RepID=A0A6L5QNJ4_9BURK|nr:HlyD family efflux transporter periplasmic adaptor subunit [Duganella alba]MRX19131.1 HlyD family efflux transporter periplasmic adaptor subunit [Duganella alba]
MNMTTTPNRKRLITRAVIAAIAIGAVGFGYHWWSTGRFVEDTDDAYIGGNVTVIAPKVAGYIARLEVSDNQLVHAGDVIARLDDRDYRAALAKAEGAVAAAQATLANLDATRQLQDAVIGQARAGVNASSAETARARDDQTRYQNLSAKAAVSLQSSQKADAEYKQALAGDQKAQAQLTAAQRELDVIGTRKQQAQAALEQAMAERDLARLNVEYTVLRAPIDGVVGNRRAREGAYATVGNQLLSIVPARGLWVDANFKEGQLARFQPGQRATIVADVMPGHVFHGTVASLAPATGAQFSVLPPENATGNFTKIVQRVPVRIVLDERDGALGTLRPGLSVNAEIDVRRADGQP